MPEREPIEIPPGIYVINRNISVAELRETIISFAVRTPEKQLDAGHARFRH